MKLLRHRRSPMALAVAIVDLSWPRSGPDLGRWAEREAGRGPPSRSSTTSTRCSRSPGSRRASGRPRWRSDEEFLRRGPTSTSSAGPPTSARPATSSAVKDSPASGPSSSSISSTHPDYPKNFATQWKVILIGRKDEPGRREVVPARPDQLAPPPVRREPPLERIRRRPPDRQGVQQGERAGQLHRSPT